MAQTSLARITRLVFALGLLGWLVFPTNGLLGSQNRQHELLVAAFDHDFTAKWCGDDAMVVWSSQSGIFWIDIKQKKQVWISRRSMDRSYGCTFDGSWAVYSDSRTIRPDRDQPRRIWGGNVIDLWRLEIKTGLRQRFAVIRHLGLGGYPALAPTAFRIFLGGRHNSAISVPPPRWESYWFDDPDWSAFSGLVWFKDSSGVIQRAEEAVHVKVFGKAGWEATLEPDLGDGLGMADTDVANRLYVLFRQDAPGRTPEMRWFLARCSISPRALTGCGMVMRDIGPFAVLPSGEILHKDQDGKCIRRSTLGRPPGECLVQRGAYAYLAWDGVSPDGKRLAFTRFVELNGRGELYLVSLGKQ